jgi:hypothetical protein
MNWCSDANAVIPSGPLTSRIGAGASNTTTAAAVCTGGAIKAAADFSGGGKTDWYLPSTGEAREMMTFFVESGIGLNTQSDDFAFWSSTQYSRLLYGTTPYMWLMGIYGTSSAPLDSPSYSVRPVRAF